MLFSYKIFRLPPYFLYMMLNELSDVHCTVELEICATNQSCWKVMKIAAFFGTREYIRKMHTLYETFECNRIFDLLILTIKREFRLLFFSLRNQMYPDHFNRLQHFLQSKFENFDFGLWYINSRTINSE